MTKSCLPLLAALGFMLAPAGFHAAAQEAETEREWPQQGTPEPTRQSTPPGDVGTERGGGRSVIGATEFGEGGFARFAGETQSFSRALATVAVERAGSDEVRQLAEELLAEVGEWDERFADSLEEEQVQGAEGQGELAARHQPQLAQLVDASDEAFDDRFLTLQLQAHRQAVNAYQAFLQTGEEGRLTDFAEQELPKLEERVERLAAMAQEGEAGGNVQQ